MTRLVLAYSLVIIAASNLGCETSDYEPLRMQKQLHEKELENKMLRDKLAKVDRSDETTREDSPSRPVDAGTTDLTPAVAVEPKMSVAEEQAIVAELETKEVYFEVDDDGFVIEADLKECRESNEALARVVEFSRLNKVLLEGTRTDDETYELLSSVTGLAHLDLERSKPSADNFAKLKDLPKLKFIQLFKATLDSDAVSQLASFPALEQIRCAQTRVGDAELKHLENLKTLRAIDLSDCNRVTPAGLESLAKCPKLAFLKVWGKSIGNNSMATVASMKSLKVLGLVDTAVDDQGIKQLAGLDLREIHLFRTSVGDEGVKVLAAMPNMVTMNLRDTRVSDKALEYIANLKQLRKLDLSECTSPGITDAGADSIVKLETLQQLNLWSTKVTDVSVEQFVKMPNLVWLNLDACNVTDETAKMVSSMEQLTWLHLGKTKVTDAAIPFLKKLPNLEYLEVTNCDISEDAKYDFIDNMPDCELIGP